MVEPAADCLPIDFFLASRSLQFEEFLRQTEFAAPVFKWGDLLPTNIDYRILTDCIFESRSWRGRPRSLLKGFVLKSENYQGYYKCLSLVTETDRMIGAECHRFRDLLLLSLLFSCSNKMNN